MPTIVDLTKKSQDQLIGAMTSAQDTVVAGYGKVSSLVTGALPKGLPTPPALPFVPKPAEVADLTFGFAEKVLAAQKAFVTKLIAAGEPAPAPKPAARAAAK
jgi:hypothetical protein